MTPSRTLLTEAESMLLSSAKGLREIDGVVKRLQAENPGAFLTDEDLPDRTFFDAPSGYLGTASRRMPCAAVNGADALRMYFDRKRSESRKSGTKN